MLLGELNQNKPEEISEIIVSDGGSIDKTVSEAQAHGAKVYLSPKRGRASQMNFGALHATGDILYFVHADSRPPLEFGSDVLDSVKSGFPIGCYRFRFDSPQLLLSINSYFTRFDKLMFRGGDQTLFVTREVFEEVGGYDQDYKIMEEYDFIKRVRKKYRFRIIPRDVIVSARKYTDNSYLRVNFANFVVFSMFRLGYSQDRMLKTYYEMLKQENNNFDLK